MIDFVEERQNITRLRESQKLKVEEAAFQAIMSEKWWYTIETGYPSTTMDTLRRIAYALNVEPLVLDIFHLGDEEIRAMAAVPVKTRPQATSKVHLGDNIVWMRKQRKMTQKQLAAAAHVSQARLRVIEHGCANAKIEVLERIADALGVSLFALCTLTIPMEVVLGMVHKARVLAGMEVE